MLKWIKRISFVTPLVVALILGITFTSENSQPIELLFYGYDMGELSVGLWVLIFLFAGSLVGLVLNFLPWLCGKGSIRSKDKKIQQLQKEIDQLRSNSVKG